MQPSAEAVAGRIPAQNLLKESLDGPLMPVLKPFEIFARVAGAPRRVSSDLRKLVPIAVGMK